MRLEAVTDLLVVQEQLLALPSLILFYYLWETYLGFASLSLSICVSLSVSVCALFLFWGEAYGKRAFVAMAPTVDFCFQILTLGSSQDQTAEIVVTHRVHFKKKKIYIYIYIYYSKYGNLKGKRRRRSKYGKLIHGLR